MIELFHVLPDPITWHRILLGIGLFIATFALSLAVVSFVLVKLPPNYFQKSHKREILPDSQRAIRLLVVFGKNVLGVLLVVLGVLMSIPGVPGQGLLTILLGIMLLDFPGKRKLELKLLSRPKVLKAINSLRHRFGKPALMLD